MFTTTHSNSVVVCTLKAQHDPGVAIVPLGWQPHLPVVPHPPYVVPQGSVLSDVIEAGRNWHQDRISTLENG